MSVTMKVKKKTEDDSVAAAGGKLKAKDYERALTKLHVELVKVQQWVVHEGLKVCIVFEGRMAPARAGRSRRSPNASVLASFVSSPCRRR